MKKRKMGSVSIGAFLLLCVFVTHAGAQSFNLRKVVDTSTPIPGGSGNFTYCLPMAISGRNVAFEGEGSSGQHGVYLFNGTNVMKVADLNTPIPAGSGNFGWLAGPEISGDNVAFVGGWKLEQRGIYLFSDGTLSKVVDLNTPIPGGVGNLTSFVLSGISGNTVVFWGGNGGIYTFDGAMLHAVVDPNNTPAPGGVGNLAVLELPVISGSNIAFIGADSSGLGQRGIYLWDGTTLSKLVDIKTPVPGGVGNFTQFAYLAISGRNVAFWGWSPDQYGVYLCSNGAVSKVLDFNTPVPGGIGTFYDFGLPEISGGNVAVRGRDQLGTQHGIYLFNGTTLSKVVDRNTPVPGGSGNFSEISIPKISGDLIVFDAGDSLVVNHGVYLFNRNVIAKIADSSTPIPAGSGNFTVALNPDISGGNVAFVGNGVSEQLGIYLASPQIVSVPTLNDWGMAIMSILLGGGGAFLLTRRRVI